GGVVVHQPQMIFIVSGFPPCLSVYNCHHLENIDAAASFVAGIGNALAWANILACMADLNWTFGGARLASGLAEVVTPGISVIVWMAFEVQELLVRVLPAFVSFELIPRLRRQEDLVALEAISPVQEDLRIGEGRGALDREQQIVSVDLSTWRAAFVVLAGARNQLRGGKILEIGADLGRLRRR